MTKPSRRDFLKLAGLGAGAAMVVGGGGAFRPAWAVPTFTGVTYLTPGYKDLFPSIVGFAEKFQKGHEKEFKVDFFHSGTLVKADEQNAALRAGTIQFMFHTTSYITRSFPILGITGLPGIVEHLYENPSRLNMESPLWKLMNDVLAKDNIFQLTCGGGILEPEYLWSGSKKVGSLSDLKGKRCRIVSYEANEVLKSFGVAGTRIPSSELYLAVQRGTVDAVLANVSTILSRKVQEQLKYVYKLPVTGFSISVYLLKDKWDKMPTKEKEALWAAGQWYDQNCATRINNEFYPQQYWPLVKKAGLEIIQPTKEELKTFADNSQPIWDWWKKQVGVEVGTKAINQALGKA